jgi:hypothetical protein
MTEQERAEMGDKAAKKLREQLAPADRPPVDAAGETSRYAAGGFSPRFVVTRVDGKSCRPGARYMVLDGSGADPHAVLALRAYALSVRGENPQLADDIERMVGQAGRGQFTGGAWPAELAQHKDAQ